MIDASKYIANTEHGKFEGEGKATEYFYTQGMLGDYGEMLYAAEEAEAFGLTVGYWFMIREDSQGFVYGSEHETKTNALHKLHEWLGLIED